MLVYAYRPATLQGSHILRVMASLYPDKAPIILFNMFECPPAQDKDVSNLTMTEKRLLARKVDFHATGLGYGQIQGTKVHRFVFVDLAFH